jgi:hypothetical protein
LLVLGLSCWQGVRSGSKLVWARERDRFRGNVIFGVRDWVNIKFCCG